MNILIIPSFFLTKKDPTSGSFFFDQATALVKQGHTVYILYCDTYSVKYISDYLNYNEICESKDGVKIFRKRMFLPLKHRDGFYGARDGFASGIIQLWNQYLKEASIDIIHAHCCEWAGYAAEKLSKLTNIPYVITEHSSRYQLDSGVIKGKHEKAIKESFQRAKAVICVSVGLKNRIADYVDDIQIIGNVVDTTLFSPEKSFKSVQSDQFVFFTVCYLKHTRQLKNKGIDQLIEAFSEVVKQHPNCKLAIGGGGAAVAEIIELVNHFNLRNHVEMLGPLSRKEVASYMQRCDAFVLPSRYETFGVAYAEALSCGKPVIATKTGGPDSFVNRDNGFLIEVDNKDQLVESMISLAEHRVSYDADRIRKNICDQFSSNAIARQLESVYKTVLGETQP